LKNLAIKVIGKAKVIVDIVRKGNPKIRPAYPMNPSELALHNTGNSGRGAGAKAHNTYIHNMASYEPKDTSHVSWHFSVDDKFVYQHLPLNESAWHTGDGNTLKSGNRNAIGIEICQNPDMDYKQAEENAIALIVYLMKELKINIQKVKPHQAYSGKYCPAVILKRDGSIAPFISRIVRASIAKPAVSQVATTKPAVSNVRVGKVTGDVWTQRTSTYSSKRRVKIVKKGASYKVYAEVGNFYNIATNEWINKNYMTITGMYTPKQLVGEILIDVWSQRNAFFLNTGRVKVLKKGSRWKVYSEKNGYYHVGGSEWVNKKFMKLV
jgi:N-acetylmuramoyl-L-alanine amidase